MIVIRSDRLDHTRKVMITARIASTEAASVIHASRLKPGAGGVGSFSLPRLGAVLVKEDWLMIGVRTGVNLYRDRDLK